MHVGDLADFPRSLFFDFPPTLRLPQVEGPSFFLVFRFTNEVIVPPQKDQQLPSFPRFLPATMRKVFSVFVEIRVHGFPCTERTNVFSLPAGSFFSFPRGGSQILAGLTLRVSGGLIFPSSVTSTLAFFIDVFSNKSSLLSHVLEDALFCLLLSIEPTRCLPLS